MIEWINVTCKFCGLKLEGYKFFPPECTCDGYKSAREEWLELQLNDPDYQEVLTQEQYDEKYPKTFSGRKTVECKDGTHQMIMEARDFGEDEGLFVCIPFESGDDDAGLGWDFTKPDARAMLELLTEYFGR